MYIVASILEKLKNLLHPQKMLRCAIKGVEKVKASVFLAIVLVVVMLIGIGLNFFSRKDNRILVTGVGTDISSWEIKKDNVNSTIGEYFGNSKAGVVCLIGSDASLVDDPYVLNIVSNDIYGWHSPNVEVPKKGVLCLVLSKDKKVIDLQLGYDKEAEERARLYSEGKRVSALRQVRQSYEELINESYVFSVCSENKCIFTNDSPEYVPANEVNMNRDEEVVVINILGEVKVYPISVLTVQPIIEDKIGLYPFAVTYDWLTNKVTVFKRVINGEQVRLRAVGKVYNSNILLYDKLTDTWWQQFNGIGVKGELKGYVLDTLPYQRVKWYMVNMLDGVHVLKSDYKALPDYVEKYKEDDRLLYSVDKVVSSPKKETIVWTGVENTKELNGNILFVEQGCNLDSWVDCQWFEPAISYRFAYELFHKN